ncbi:MAG TPA: pantoate--beta-alanine ligase [Gammaproteobacteria bacterium]|nr:pantoate--beta-alanine ligase [Gammaproteobacteria bacterium]
MNIIDTVAELRSTVSQWRTAGQRIALVPTMGNLHAGHLQLVEEARQRAKRVVVSIFVNPMQFTNVGGDGKDFERYPRTLAADCEKLGAMPAAPEVVFAPSVDEVYPHGFEQQARVEVPGIGDILEGEFRPGHFTGVATVVAKLFNMSLPDVALFGEKDFQQLLVIRRLTAELCFPVEIIGIPTVREANGLAMSSRNQYLSDEERQTAALLYQTLQEVKQQIEAGAEDSVKLCTQAMAQLQDAGFRPEYFELRRSSDLQPADPQDKDGILLSAAWLGEARLIDNLRLS